MASEDGTYIALLHDWGHEGAISLPSLCQWRALYDCIYIKIKIYSGIKIN